jgi:hypothetical protein
MRRQLFIFLHFQDSLFSSAINSSARNAFKVIIIVIKDFGAFIFVVMSPSSWTASHV